MKIVHLEGSVDESMRDIVTNALNEEWEVTFYLNSHGGKSQFAYQIIDIINKNKDRVTLIAVLQIASAAFRIFFEVECKREILWETEWLAHMARMDVRMDGNKDIGSTDKWRVQQMKKQEGKKEKKLKLLWMSKKNRKLFLKGYDIYINTKKLHSMLKKHEKYLNS